METKARVSERTNLMMLNVVSVRERFLVCKVVSHRGIENQQQWTLKMHVNIQMHKYMHISHVHAAVGVGGGVAIGPLVEVEVGVGGGVAIVPFDEVQIRSASCPQPVPRVQSLTISCAVHSLAQFALKNPTASSNVAAYTQAPESTSDSPHTPQPSFFTQPLKELGQSNIALRAAQSG